MVGDAQRDGGWRAFARRRGVVIVVGVVALVIVLAATGVLRTGSDDGPQNPLPEYALLVDGGAGELRADAPFDLALRPASSVTGKVAAFVFTTGDGEPNPVDAKVDIADGGVVHVAGRARALTGAREVRVVVGVASEFKRYEDALVRARAGNSDARMRVVTVRVVR